MYPDLANQFLQILIPSELHLIDCFIKKENVHYIHILEYGLIGKGMVINKNLKIKNSSSKFLPV